MLTIKQLLSKATKELQSKNINNALLDARILLQFILNKPYEYLLLNDQQILDSIVITKFNNLLLRRMNFEPIAYIIGYKEFYGREFFVDQNVLIPRADTELLIEKILENNNPENYLKVLELGSGSGCIIITSLLEMPNITGVAIDISENALKLTQKNLDKNGLNNRIELIQSNWFENLKNIKFDIIISNPPYIDKNEINLMSTEALSYEPSLALFASDKGLANYHIIAQNAKNYLNENGQIWLEIGYNQAEPIEKIFIENDYQHLKTYQDLSLKDRVMVFKPH